MGLLLILSKIKSLPSFHFCRLYKLDSNQIYFFYSISAHRHLILWYALKLINLLNSLLFNVLIKYSFHFINIFWWSSFSQCDEFFCFSEFINFIAKDICICYIMFHFNIRINYISFCRIWSINRYIEWSNFLFKLFLINIDRSTSTGETIALTSLVYNRRRPRTTLPIFLNFSIALFLELSKMLLEFKMV